MDAARLRAPQQRADVLGILERIKDQHERWLAAFPCPAEDLVQGGPSARLDDERHALVSIEAADPGQRAALDLDDRDPE